MADQAVNPIKNNQFVAYFSKLPQTGANSHNQYLKTADLDFFNKTIKEVIFPGINLSDIRIPFKGHIDTVIPGDEFRIDPINITFTLSQNAENYKAILNWCLIQKDVITGTGKNPNFNLDGCLAELIFDFIDVFIENVFQVKFDVHILAIPPLTFTPNAPKPEPQDFSVMLSTVNMKVLYDVQQGTA